MKLEENHRQLQIVCGYPVAMFGSQSPTLFSWLRRVIKQKIFLNKSENSCITILMYASLRVFVLKKNKRWKHQTRVSSTKIIHAPLLASLNTLLHIIEGML
ncbi:hypothetical protein VNO77_06463 [Canavalia gladiata]|uniref:Uncharacterized protein n=1 Tax=Canavalia gladiata TaxID=3824 RepID=A0AAN9QVM2_CANGL